MIYSLWRLDWLNSYDKLGWFADIGKNVTKTVLTEEKCFRFGIQILDISSCNLLIPKYLERPDHKAASLKWYIPFNLCKVSGQIFFLICRPFVPQLNWTELNCKHETINKCERAKKLQQFRRNYVVINVLTDYIVIFSKAIFPGRYTVHFFLSRFFSISFASDIRIGACIKRERA